MMIMFETSKETFDESDIVLLSRNYPVLNVFL